MQEGTFSESVGSLCSNIHGVCNDLKWKWIFDKPKAEKDNIRKKKDNNTSRCLADKNGACWTYKRWEWLNYSHVNTFRTPGSNGAGLTLRMFGRIHDLRHDLLKWGREKAEKRFFSSFPSENLMIYFLPFFWIHSEHEALFWWNRLVNFIAEGLERMIWLVSIKSTPFSVWPRQPRILKNSCQEFRMSSESLGWLPSRDLSEDLWMSADSMHMQICNCASFNRVSFWSSKFS